MAWRFWARTHPAQLNTLLNTFGDASGDDCEAIEPLLSLYGDGMASPAEARLVEAHLPGCEACRESLAWMQATRRALSGRPVQSPPANLHARIAEAIAASDAAPLRLRPARTFTTRPAFAAAASLAAVGLFLGYSLTHLPHPGVAVKPVPSQTVANVPAPPPTVTVVPLKPTAPSVTAKKSKPAPLVADKNVPDDKSPAPFTAPASRAAAKNAVRPVQAAPITAPRQKPVAPRPNSLMAVKTPAPVKVKALKPLPPKASVLTARVPKEPNVQVLPVKITPQESPAPEQIASATSSEPRTQTVDYLHEVSARLASAPTHFSRTVGLSVRGAARVTRTFGEDTGAKTVADIHSPNF